MSKYVYLFRGSEEWEDVYKIGISDNAGSRLKSMAGMPFAVTMAHSVLCERARDIEKGLHKLFDDRRMNGEWFRLSDDEVAMITDCVTESNLMSLTGFSPEDKPDGEDTALRGMRWKLKTLIAECAEVMGERLTYRQIEADLGISKTTLSHIAQNKTTRTDLDTLNHLLGYLSRKLGRPLVTNDLLEFVPDSPEGKPEA